jgi:glycosyltransferase involved in cell wall biosynthesis
VIFDCREDFVGYALQRPGIPDFLRRPLAFLIGRQLESAARNCDALIVADQGTGDRLKGHAHRILVLHNFPRLDLFPYREQREDEKSFDIVYHGTIPRYYMEVCLRIDDALLEHGTQVRWRLINKGTPDMDWFRAELARRGALQRFTLDGPVPHEQIASEVRKARIGIILLPNLPMFQSNIPRKLFEFMALGMPVVLSDLPPIRPFVSHGESAFLVSPDDYGAYAGAIARLLNDADLRQQMGAAGRRLVEQEYNWETESEKLLRLYSDLLSQ